MKKQTTNPTYPSYTLTNLNEQIKLKGTDTLSQPKKKEHIIELPSDEDIDKYIEKTFYGVKKHYFKAGVEFMRELILNQNK